MMDKFKCFYKNYAITTFGVLLAGLLLCVGANAAFDGTVKIIYTAYLILCWGLVTVCFFRRYVARNILLINSMISGIFLYSYSNLFGVGFGLPTVNSVLFICLSIAFATIFFNRFRLFYISRVVIILFYTLITFCLGSAVIFYKTTGRVAKDVVFAILQTNTSESIEYISSFVSVKYVFLGIFILLCEWLILWKILKGTCIKVKQTWVLLGLFFISLGAGVFSLQQSNYKDFINVSKWRDEYFAEIEAWKKVKDQRKVANDIQAFATKKGQLHIVVIGESLSRYHLSAYGYPLETSPWIGASADVILSQPFSNHTHTVPVLSRALVQANQYNQYKYYETPSIINVLQAAEFNVAWLSTQLKVGTWDNIISVLADDADYKVFLNEDSVGETTNVRYKDKALIPALKKYLKTLDYSKNNLVFLHTMGSHTDYCRRTKGEDVIIENYEADLFGGKQDECYDLSVKYTDELLQGVHEVASAYASFTSMVFLSDHGDDVFDDLGHNSAKFTEYMAQIPFVFWYSDNLDTEISDGLQLNKDKVFTNDLLFDTLLGLYGVNSPFKEAKFDITNKQYELKEPLTLHGKKKIAELPLQIAKVNLKGNNQFMAHRINTVGAMIDAGQQGFKNIEVDVFYDSEINKIVVGHGKSQSTGTLFSDFLKYENNVFNRIWVDFKNLDSTNMLQILKELNQLDVKFRLKSRVLLESDCTDSSFVHFSNDGWFTSYYLPTKKFSKYDFNNDEGGYVNELINQLAMQHVSSVSFDASIYPNIKGFLQTELFKKLNLELNIWTVLKVDDKNFVDKLKQIEVMKEPNLSSVIVKSITRFYK